MINMIVQFSTLEFVHMLNLITANDKSLARLKFGDSACEAGGQTKVWQISSICQIRQTLVTPIFRHLW